MTLKTKITLSFTLCISLFFSIMIALIQQNFNEFSISSTHQKNSELIQSKANELSYWMEQRVSELRVLANSESILNLDFDRIPNEIRQINESVSLYYGDVKESLAFGGLDGIGWINPELSIDVSSRAYFKEAMGGKQPYVLSLPVESKSSADDIMVICYPIKDEKREVIGFINGAITLKKFSEITAQLQIPEQASWVMNQDGIPYTQLSDSLLNEQVPLGNLATKIGENAHGIISIETANSESSTLYYSQIPHSNGLILCSLIHDEVLFAPLKQLMEIFLGLWALLILVVLAVSYLLARTITRPIEQLKSQMKAVEHGYLKAYVDVESHDEIGELGHGFNTMLMTINRLIDQVFQEQSSKRIAELKVLQAQINPHFLYNTLDTLKWKAIKHQAYDVADLIAELSGFFRISLSDGKQEIPLAKECEHMVHYLNIQKTRYRDQFDYECHLDEDCEKVLCLKLILQPLVENAIYHGIKGLDRFGHIRVTIERVSPYIRILVKDNGHGVNETELKQLRCNLSAHIESNHYGLFNISERLHLTYGESAHFEINSQHNVGFEVKIEIPEEGL